MTEKKKEDEASGTDKKSATKVQNSKEKDIDEKKPGICKVSYKGHG